MLLRTFCIYSILCCFTILLTACVTRHYFYSTTPIIEMAHGRILTRVFHYYNNEKDSTKYLEKGGTMVTIGFDYYPEAISNEEVELTADSIMIYFPNSQIRKDLSASDYLTLLYGGSKRLLLDSLIVPKEDFKRFELSLLFTAFKKSDGSILDKQHLNMEIFHRKEREIYWGK